MADDKKIKFTGEDNISSKARQIYSSLIADAKKYNETQKEQVSYLQQQVKLYEKKTQLQQKEASKTIEHARSQLGGLKGAPLKERITEVNALRQSSERSQKENSQIIDTLKQLLNESKKETRTTEKVEKETERETLRKAKYEDLRQARIEVQENKKGVKAKIEEAEREGYGGMSVAQIEKLNYQKSLVGNQPESNFKSTLKALLVNDLVEGVVRSFSSIVTQPTGFHSFNNLLSAIPFVGGPLSDTMKASFEEQSAVGIEQNKLRAMSGAGRNGKADIGLAGNTDLGFSSRESLQLQTGMMKAMGSSNIDTNVSQAQRLEKGLGLDESTLLSIAKTMRTVGSSADLVTVVSKVLKSNPDLAKDQTKTAEVLNAQIMLTNQLSKQTEHADWNEAGSMIGLLRSVGGSMANNPEMLQQNMSSINQSLSNPSSQFQKARSFGVLNRMSGGGSYLKMLEMQEKGIGQKGYLSSMLKELQQETGGGENFALAAKENLGLSSYSTAEALTKDFVKNPSKWANFKGTNADINNSIVSGNRALDLTHERDKMQAKQSEAYLKGPAQGAIEAVNQVFLVGAGQIKKAISSLSDAIWSSGDNGIKHQ